MELATLRDITESELHRIRKQGDLVSIYDVIHAMTGDRPATIRKAWQRLTEDHPELVTRFHKVKFTQSGRGSNQETPATDAQGIWNLIMCLRGKAAAGIRERTAETMVRYLGGDETLVAEIRTNRIAQEHLAATNPEHPARLFGEAVESERDQRLPSGSSEEQNARRLQSDADGHNVRVARLNAIKATKEVADQRGFAVTPNLRKQAEDAVNEVLLPPGWEQKHMVDAADYLELRRHNEIEIQ